MAYRIHGQRVGILFVAAVGVAVAFLPWISVPRMGAIAGTAGADGWLVVGLSLLGGLTGLLGDRAAPMTMGPRGLLALSGIGLMCIGVWKLDQLFQMQDSLEVAAADQLTHPMTSTVLAGEGLYLVLVVGLALLMLGVLWPSRATAVVASAGRGMSAGSLTCAKCGAPMAFLSQYQRWHCQIDPRH